MMQTPPAPNTLVICDAHSLGVGRVLDLDDPRAWAQDFNHLYPQRRQAPGYAQGHIQGTVPVEYANGKIYFESIGTLLHAQDASAADLSPSGAVTNVYYPGTRAEEQRDGTWGPSAWHEDLVLVPGGPGYWVNGGSVRGVGLDVSGQQPRLVGKPTQGRSPEAWLARDSAGGWWVCVREGYGVAAKFHRVRVPR